MYISAYSTKNCTSGIRTSGDRTSGGPPVVCTCLAQKNAQMSLGQIVFDSQESTVGEEASEWICKQSWQ